MILSVSRNNTILSVSCIYGKASDGTLDNVFSLYI